MTPQMTNYTPGRLYPIAFRGLDWLQYQPGTLPDGSLAILGRLPPQRGLRQPGPYPVGPELGVFFSADGTYLRHEILPIPAMIDPAWPQSQQSEFSVQHILDARSRWSADIGFTPGTIQVQYFALPEFMIGIADWPNHLFRERLLAGSDPELLAELNEDERHQEWIEGGFYVLYWGNDFWMHPDGTISST
ncbi:hypothetical protein [Tuwongella immobilis]|uniref:Uncharacterized protein n=1 Tax=Tuwongella immobilis TaxID=692036 RepID=A0A6C2YV79_9BACT|nr:hypothetical protein [Tuwongella immobilis]VIP05277.1 unnamed protein product [Tuwongella immobilis]VTS07910.1 unnamed protein product [Tuwongella immobilis]